MNQQSVQLSIQANTAQFATSIHRAEQDFKSKFRNMGAVFKSQSNRIRSDFSSIALGAQGLSQGIRQTAKSFLVLTGAATGIGLIGKKMLNLADGTAKTADRICFTTDSLQELRLAASLTGVTQEKLESSLERFPKRLGEAANGTGIAANPLTIPVVTVPVDGDISSRADKLLDKIPAKARGGLR